MITRASKSGLIDQSGLPQSVVDWVDDLSEVTGNELREKIRDYVRNIQYAYLGNPRLVPQEQMLKR